MGGYDLLDGIIDEFVDLPIGIVPWIEGVILREDGFHEVLVGRGDHGDDPFPADAEMAGLGDGGDVAEGTTDVVVITCRVMRGDLGDQRLGFRLPLQMIQCVVGSFFP